MFNGLVAIISIAVHVLPAEPLRARARGRSRWAATGTRRIRIERIADRIYRVIAGYVVGIFLVALTGGFAVWLFLTILGVPFALLLGFWAGLASLVPLVGATVGGIPYIAVAFFQGWPIGVAAIVFLIVYQQIENNVFQPVIHRYTVQLNPLWVILAVLIGGNPARHPRRPARRSRSPGSSRCWCRSGGRPGAASRPPRPRGPAGEPPDRVTPAVEPS